MLVFIDAVREGYNPSQVFETMTVGELAETFTTMAKRIGEDAPVYLRHDGGYTYGGITPWLIEAEEGEEDEE